MSSSKQAAIATKDGPPGSKKPTGAACLPFAACTGGATNNHEQAAEALIQQAARQLAKLLGRLTAHDLASLTGKNADGAGK